MSLPSVSVVIPCFNYGRFLGRAVDSALAVDYPADKVEIIVVDDGSTDDTPEVIASYGDRIRSIRQANSGANAANETGIKAATGDLIAFLDADDEWPADRLQVLVGALEANPDAGLAYGDMQLIDVDGNELAPSFHAATGFKTSSGRIYPELVPGNFISAPALIVRSSLREHFMPFPSHVGWHDWWIALQVSRVSEVVFVDHVVARYRQHGENSNNGATGDRWTRVLRKEIDLRRWLAATVDIDEAGPESLFKALQMMLGMANHIAEADGVRITDVLPVRERERKAAMKASRAASLAFKRRDLRAALGHLIHAAAHDPSNGESIELAKELLALVRAEEAPAPKVLCYSPYNWWALHGRQEMTILNALKLRGADVTYVMCDGMFTDCDIFWAATAPRPANACALCQSKTSTLAAQLGMDYGWLGRYLNIEERDEARRWAESLPVEELMTATYGDYDVAAWVTPSIHSHFRRSQLDVADPKVEEAFRSYLYSGLIASFALDRLLDDSQPDVMLLFNGRQSSTRVALHLARRRGIRVITHERGPRTETVSLGENVNCVSLQPLRDFWGDWGHVPLTAAEIATIGQHLHEREHGVGLGWKAFSTAPQEPEEVRAALGLSPERPTWVLFTSSDDEVVSEDQWQGDFSTQLEWIERTVAHAAANPGIDLVIRVHPNTGSKRSTGANRKQLDELARLAESLPQNVRIVPADAELSSYTLMAIATVGLAYHSTVALELACKGTTTVVAAGSLVTGMPFVHTVERADGYEAMLDELVAIEPGTVDREAQRLAWRFAYGRFYRVCVDFPLVRMPDPAGYGELDWNSSDDLQPGRDAGLDRCARILLDGEPITAAPSDADRARSDADEVEFFGLTADRRFTALAFAEELVADDDLLPAWGRTFSAADAATLVIQTPADAVERLIAAVSRAGLDADGSPDLVAIDADPAELAPFDAVFSRTEPGGTLAGTPRFDDTSIGALRQHAAG